MSHSAPSSSYHHHHHHHTQFLSLITNTIQQISANPYNFQLYQKLAQQWYNMRRFREAWRLNVIGRHFVHVSERADGFGTRTREMHLKGNVKDYSLGDGVERGYGSQQQQQMPPQAHFQRDIHNRGISTRHGMGQDSSQRPSMDILTRLQPHSHENVPQGQVNRGTANQEKNTFDSIVSQVTGKGPSIATHVPSQESHSSSVQVQTDHEGMAAMMATPRPDTHSSALPPPQRLSITSKESSSASHAAQRRMLQRNSIAHASLRTIATQTSTASTSSDVATPTVDAHHHRAVYERIAREKQLKKLQNEVLQQAQLIDSLRREIGMLRGRQSAQT